MYIYIFGISYYCFGVLGLIAIQVSLFAHMPSDRADTVRVYDFLSGHQSLLLVLLGLFRLIWSSLTCFMFHEYIQTDILI